MPGSALGLGISNGTTNLNAGEFAVAVVILRGANVRIVILILCHEGGLVVCACAIEFEFGAYNAGAGFSHLGRVLLLQERDRKRGVGLRCSQ